MTAGTGPGRHRALTIPSHHHHHHFWHVPGPAQAVGGTEMSQPSSLLGWAHGPVEGTNPGCVRPSAEPWAENRSDQQQCSLGLGAKGPHLEKKESATEVPRVAVPSGSPIPSLPTAASCQLFPGWARAGASVPLHCFSPNLSKVSPGSPSFRNP